jgi:TonB-dependent receptor
MLTFKTAIVKVGAAAICSLVLMSAAFARAEDRTPREFDIGPQSLAAALSEFARQADQEILFAPQIVAEKSFLGIRGRYPPLSALREMLEGTGLRFTITRSGAILIQGPGSAALEGADGETDAQREFWNRFLMAQAGGGSSGAAPGSQPEPAASSGSEDRPRSNSRSMSESTEEIDEVVVTGYRGSLLNSTKAKRESTSFTDSIFSEDIGKFPDTNIAEAFNRIPGIQITREVSGEGLNIAIRGLGPSFTNILLNNAPIEVASTGRTDAQGTSRQIDLNVLPPELFTQLTVNKSPTADLIEGGAAGTVNMRSLRPFDNPGGHVTYSLQGQYASADKVGPKATLIASNTWDTFGALVGVTGSRTDINATGHATIFWTNPTLSSTQCTAPTGCNSTGGGFWFPAGSVPDNASTIAAGLTPGETIDEAWLLRNNPGLTIKQIDDALMPVIARPEAQFGRRDRLNAVVSLEYRPSDALHFYLDAVGGINDNDIHRTDVNFVLPYGSIPVNMQVNADNVVTSGVFPNSYLLLEDRPFTEKTHFLGVNPGVEWNATDRLKFELRANATRSDFFRDYPTIGLFTAPTVITYSNPDGADHPTFTSAADMNNPANWGWGFSQRAYVQQEKRTTSTDGGHLDVSYGDERLTLKAGAAYDVIERNIRPRDNSAAWQAAVCGGNPNVYLPVPNSQPPCTGLEVGFPAYPGYGTGYSAGAPPLAWQGSLSPQGDVPNYLVPGPQGYAIVDWPAFQRASNYSEFAHDAPFSPSSNTGAAAGSINEKNLGFYVQLNGILTPGGRNLRYNLGARQVRTEQSVAGPVAIADPRNATLQDGGLYPNTYAFPELENTYDVFLPSLNLAYEAADNFQVRLALSKTMTRPDPVPLLPGVNFSDANALLASLGNPRLAPYFSKNIDFGAELYTGDEGYVGMAAFRKSITGFTVLGTTNHPFSDLAAYGITYDVLTPTQQGQIDSRGGPQNASVIFQQQLNASGTLTINGLEFSWVQPLDFLLERHGLKGFGFSANVTMVDQKGSGAAPAIATGVSPTTYNFVGYYEGNGASIRLSYVYNDKLQATGLNQSNIAEAAVFNRAYSQMDFSASYKLAGLFGDLPSDPEVTFNVQNVLDDRQLSYFQFSSAGFSDYRPGRLISLGVRGRF